MDFVEWQSERREMSRAEVNDFYENPLCDITVFRFDTAGLEMPEHHGAFSLKSVRLGQEHYFFHGRSLSLCPHQVLLVNAGERYGSEITEPTSSLAVFYRDFELSHALDALTVPPDLLLDNGVGDREVNVAQIAQTNDSAVLERLAALHSALDIEDDELATEAAMLLLLSTLRQNRQIAPPSALAGVRKRSTRDELVARVLKACTVINDTHGQVRDLDALAEVACLSRYHFIRVFTEVTGVTPVTFARRERLRFARWQLQNGVAPSSVSRQAGYTSFKSFSRAYQRQFASTP